MNNKAIYIIKKDGMKSYPNKEDAFRPSQCYPEYLFGKEISTKPNNIYDMVRECFRMMELDILNFGSKTWNPLGEFVQPGNHVLLKPNLVSHENGSGCGTECLYTNPSLVAAIVDYVYIALKGEGKIIIGDAPVQECDFKKLCEESGYDRLLEFYRRKGLDLELLDFRNVKTYERNGIRYLQEEEEEEGIVVKLNQNSAFLDISEEQMKNLRITNYDPRILQRHHHGHLHEYKISQYVLDADVIINMPKPKTHRKAGVTIALKNLVGINTNKEYLPHHMNGSKAEGGDAYLNSDVLLHMANEVLDIKNILIRENEVEIAEEAACLYQKLLEKGCSRAKEQYWEGSWYGNDTIWRTILDVNRIFWYTDKKGILTTKKQRKMFIVGDMIVSGQKEGPLGPSPIYPGAIVMGDNPLNFDRAVCSLMGFNYQEIPSLSDRMKDGDLPISEDVPLQVVSNYAPWNGFDMERIRNEFSLEFQPSAGWVKLLGNKYKEKLYCVLLEMGKPVYIFGAGVNGLAAANEIKKYGIKIAAFCDNNSTLWGSEIADGLHCISLASADMNLPFIVAVRDKIVPEVEQQICSVGGRVAGIVNGF